MAVHLALGTYLKLLAGNQLSGNRQLGLLIIQVESFERGIQSNRVGFRRGYFIEEDVKREVPPAVSILGVEGRF